MHIFLLQNQTEAEPDLSQKPALAETEEIPLAKNSTHTNNIKPHVLSAIEIMKHNFAGPRQVVEQVGENVGQIVSGVLGGGISNVFAGSSNFIGDTSVQQEVDFVLNNVAPPLETIVKYGFQGLKQYFGIGQTTVKTEVTAMPVTEPPVEQIFLQPIVFENGTVQYIPIYHTVTKPSVIVSETENPPEDNDEIFVLAEIDEIRQEDASPASDKLVAERSRVDRLHLI